MDHVALFVLTARELNFSSFGPAFVEPNICNFFTDNIIPLFFVFLLAITFSLVLIFSYIKKELQFCMPLQVLYRKKYL